MDTLKYKLLSYIHHSDSYFAKKIRNYLPISWKDILCDYELNDLNTALLMTTKKHEAEYESESDEDNDHDITTYLRMYCDIFDIFEDIMTYHIRLGTIIQIAA